jgi:hypothetical protein
MEFSYKLSEAEYLLAGRIAVKRPGQPWARVLAYGYLLQIFLIVWGSFLAGMVLERSDMVGVTANDIQKTHAVREIVPASIVPAIALFFVIFLLLRMRLLRYFDRRRRLEHFRTDPGCQAETSVTATRQMIAFRSATGSSESSWGCYAAWAELNGILILVTCAGVRKILKISGLSESEKEEFRSLLNLVLPKE